MEPQQDHPARQAAEERLGSDSSESAPSRGSVAYTAKPRLERPRPRRWRAALAALALVGALAGGYVLLTARAPAGGGGPPGAVPADFSRAKVLRVGPGDLDAAATAQARRSLQAGVVPPELSNAQDGILHEVAAGSRVLYRLRLETGASAPGQSVALASEGLRLAAAPLDAGQAGVLLALRPNVSQPLEIVAGGSGPALAVTARSSVGQLTSGRLAAGGAEDWTIVFEAGAR